jgi:hypothetical protein
VEVKGVMAGVGRSSRTAMGRRTVREKGISYSSGGQPEDSFVKDRCKIEMKRTRTQIVFEALT